MPLYEVCGFFLGFEVGNLPPPGKGADGLQRLKAL
jgi:hypothetical protein